MLNFPGNCKSGTPKNNFPGDCNFVIEGRPQQNEQKMQICPPAAKCADFGTQTVWSWTSFKEGPGAKGYILEVVCGKGPASRTHQGSPCTDRSTKPYRRTQSAHKGNAREANGPASSALPVPQGTWKAQRQQTKPIFRGIAGVQNKIEHPRAINEEEPHTS